MNTLLPFRRVDLVRLMDQRERFFLLQSLFFRIYLQRNLDTVLRKKLLRLDAALSPGAVVPPIDSSHEDLLHQVIMMRTGGPGRTLAGYADAGPPDNGLWARLTIDFSV